MFFIFIFVDCKHLFETIMNASKILRRSGKILLWIFGIWMGLLLILQIVLLSPIFTNIANSVTEGLFDAQVSIGSAYGSVLRHFPRITFTVEDLEITYPHERYDSIAKAGVQGHLLYSGCGESVDTLASIKKLSASVSLLSLISGDIKLPHIDVDSPKLYAHSYDQNHANWNIFFEDEEVSEQVDTTAGDGESMNIILKSLSITGRPRIVYTDCQDSLFALITLRDMSFDGHFETNALHNTLADSKLEHLFVAGRYGADTLALGLDMLKTIDMDTHMRMEIQANTFLATEAFGRMKVPIFFASDISLPEDSGMAVSLRNMEADIATIPASGDLDVVLLDDKVAVEGQIGITQCKLQKVLHDYLAHFVPELNHVKTNTVLSAATKISGSYNFETGTLPEIEVSIDIPDSEIDYDSFPKQIEMGMNGSFQMDSTGTMHADVTKARIHTYGLGLDTAFGIEDITGEDPKIRIDGDIKASLDSLRHFLPDSLNLIARGDISAELKGTIKMSEMDMYTFSNAGLEGNIICDEVIFQMPDDTIDVRMDGMDIRLKPEVITSRRDPSRSFRLMGINGLLASADITYKDAFTFKGNKIDVGARNSADNDKEEQQSINYLGGHVNAGLLQINDSEGTSIKLDNTKNTFQMRPKRGQPNIPVLSLTNQNQRITYITNDNRTILTDSKFAVKASMNTLDRAKRREAFMDSLAKAHPGVPRDSMFAHLRALRAVPSVPSWMMDKELRSSDIKVNLNETLKKYYREWDVEGKAGIRTGIIMSPYFPLRNILRGTSMSFDNDRVGIDSLKMMSGDSEIKAIGELSGLRRVMLGRGNIMVDLDLSSGNVNADELLKAYTVGSQFVSDTTSSNSEISNSEFFKQVTTEAINAESSEPTLLILPGNVVASINLDASGIKYKDLNISSFTADMLIKERCAQLTKTTMRSNMGGFDLEAFYATKSKKDIRTGFCLDIKDVTSERVIALMPEIAEVMPMVGSIHGKLNCEFAATASLDTTMSIIMPTVNGIVRLKGHNLSISDDEVYTSVAKMLLFKNKKKGEINELSIEGAIKDNRLEIFPFILKVDRYTLGLSGVQNMDMSFKHHVSVLRSPLLIRLGLNLSGPDYDNMKFRLGRAQYRIKKIPSFSSVIDQTKSDLKNSIYTIFDTGIDKTIGRQDMHSRIVRHQSAIGYTNAAEVEMEELSKDEQEQLKESENTEAVREEAIAAAVAAVQEVLKNN